MARVPGRFVNKVTYAPIRPSPEDVASGRIEARRRGLEKVMFANALRATPAEVEASKAQVAHEDRAALGALDAIGELAKGGSRGGRDGWREIGRQSPEALIKAGRAVAVHRRVRQAELREAAEQLVSEHAAETRKSLEATAGGPRTAGRTRRVNAPAI